MQEKNIKNLPNETIGDRLYKVRKDKGLNQAELAEQIGFKQSSTISKIESDRIDPDSNTLKKIAEILDIDLHWLITGNPAPYNEQRDKNYQRIFADFSKHISWSIAFLLEERDKREIEISKLEKKGDRLNLDLIKVINDEADNIQQHLSELVKLQPEIQKILTDLLTPKNTKKP
ncbi:MAG: helix-turn-helix domain-containing protein [Sedimentisphaerales bacterium]